MSTVLYYFSGTGNSYVVAKELQKEIGDCELIPLTQYLNTDKIEVNSKNIGFVFPLYFQSMPKFILEFIKRLDIHENPYIFAVVTRGGGAYQGGVLKHLKKILEAKSQKLSAGFYVKLPENFIPMLKVPSEKAQTKLFQQAEQKLRKISSYIIKNTQKVEGEPLFFIRPVMYGHYLKKLKTVHTNFIVTDRCTNCGICEKVCRLKNIEMSDGKPTWKNGCQLCVACINYCPCKAIELWKSQNKSRYHHPLVPVQKYLEI